MKINKEWLDENDFGKAECVELAIFSAESVLPAWEADHPNRLGPRRVIDAAKACLEDPSHENSRAAYVAAQAAGWYDVVTAVADAAACAAWACVAASDSADGCVMDAIRNALAADPSVEQAIIDKANEIIKRR